MKRVYALPPNENWIVDEICRTWNKHNSDMATSDIFQSDIIWNVANWCWRRIPVELLNTRKIITTVHHIVPEKWDKQDFLACDEVTDAYHVPNEHTREFIKQYTQKDIYVIPYWCDQHTWSKTLDFEGCPEDIIVEKIDGMTVMSLKRLKISVNGITAQQAHKRLIRTMCNLPDNAMLVGSFQRDTEGAGIPNGIFLPKLEKGPDLFCDYVEKLARETKIHVVLAGWRRQYVISRLKAANIDYSYFELPSQGRLKALYQCLDLYPVTSRYEGGPQAFLECGALGVPVVSRCVGMAHEVLSPSAINDDVSLAKPEVPNVEKMLLPHGFKAYREMFDEI